MVEYVTRRRVRTEQPGAPARRRVVGFLLLIIVPTSVSANTDALINVTLFAGIGAMSAGIVWYALDGWENDPPNETRNALFLGGLISFGIAIALYLSSIGKTQEALDVIEQMSMSLPSLEQMPSLEQVVFEQVIEEEEEG